MPYILYFGHVNIDVALRVKEFGKIGESRAVESYESRVGGTAYNSYRTLRSLGVPAEIFSVVGPDIEGLEGIFVRDDKTPSCWIVSNGEEQIAYMYQGLWEKLDTTKIEIPVQNYEVLHFSTGNPRFYIKLARLARKLGKLIGFDPSQEIHYVYDKNTFRELLSLSDLFFCNEKEFEKAMHLSGGDMDDKIIIRTEGSKGASIYTPDRGWTHVPGNSAEIVDTLGAGDSFRAGFYAALYYGYNLMDAVKIGNLVASSVVSSTRSYYTGSWKDIESMGKKI